MYSYEELKIILSSGHLSKGTSRWVLLQSLEASRADAPLIAWGRSCAPCLPPKDTLIVTVTTFRCEASETSLHSLSNIFLDRTTVLYSRKNQEGFPVNAGSKSEVVADLHRASDSLGCRSVRLLHGNCSCPPAKS